MLGPLGTVLTATSARHGLTACQNNALISLVQTAAPFERYVKRNPDYAP
jgi:hypothetical protein